MWARLSGGGRARPAPRHLGGMLDRQSRQVGKLVAVSGPDSTLASIDGILTGKVNEQSGENPAVRRAFDQIATTSFATTL